MALSDNIHKTPRHERLRDYEYEPAPQEPSFVLAWFVGGALVSVVISFLIIIAALVAAA